MDADELTDSKHFENFVLDSLKIKCTVFLIAHEVTADRSRK